MIHFRTSKISDVLRVQLVRETAEPQSKCCAPQDISYLWSQTVAKRTEYDPDKETFAVFVLDAKHKCRHVDVVGVGVLNACLVHPREVFRKAVALGAAAIVIAHNHPSGDTTPSAEDIRISRQLVEAGRILDIQVLDSLIIAEDKSKCWIFTSFREAGLVEF